MFLSQAGVYFSAELFLRKNIFNNSLFLMNTKKKDVSAVKIEKTVLPQSKMKLVFSVPAEEFEKLSTRTATELSAKMKFDGFRAGKVPEKMVVETIGEEIFLAEMTERAVKKFYVDGILDEKIPVIGSPEVKIVSQGRNQDLIFEAEISVYPTVQLNDWKKAAQKALAQFSDEKIGVEEKEVQKELNFLANQRSKTALVDRACQLGDQAEIDFEVFKDGAIIEGGVAKKHLLVLGENKFIPGFEEELVGLKAGEEKEFKLKFPKQYHSQFLAGQECLFKVKVTAVWERILPEINDEFAKGIGRFENLEKLSANIREGIQQEKENELLNKKQMAVLENLVAVCSVELPEVLVVSETEKMLGELAGRLAMMGMKKEDYFLQTGTTEEDLKKKWQTKEAVSRVKAGLVIAQIAKEERIEPENEEVEEKMNLFLQYYKNTGAIEKNQVDLKGLYERAKGELINQKVLEHLLKLK